MGNSASDNSKDTSGIVLRDYAYLEGEPVILNVYDGKEAGNMPTLGFGVYHTGLQVHGTGAFFFRSDFITIRICF
jgi:hypothetical protein